MSEKLKLEKLLDFFDEIEIPLVIPKEKDLFAISGYPHYENVLSNLYRFYFSYDEDHGFGNKLCSILIEEINEKLNENISLSRLYQTKIETSTDENGRVDLSLTDNQTAIIIENKVYHSLQNNLDDYVNSYHHENKVLVLLTLNQYSLPVLKDKSVKVVNITHLHLLNRLANFLKEFGKVNKYTIYLDELFQNIKKLSSITMQEEIVSFYQTHVDKINNIIKLSNDFKRGILSEVDSYLKSNTLLKDFILKKEDSGFYYQLRSKKVNKLMIILKFDKLQTSENRIELIIKLDGYSLKSVKAKFEEKEFSESLISKYSTQDSFFDSGKYMHVYKMDVIPTTRELCNIGETLMRKFEYKKDGQSFLDRLKDLENDFIKVLGTNV
jgi:hypothetical protein